MDFDQDRIFYSHQNLQQQAQPGNEVDPDDIDVDGEPDLGAVRRHLREFLRNYRQAPHRYVYRERLLRMHRRSSHVGAADDDGKRGDVGGGAIEVDLAHLGEYDAALLDLLLSRPAHILPPFEMGAADALRTMLFDLKSSDAENSQEGGTRESQAQENTAGGDDLSGGLDETGNPIARDPVLQSMSKSAEQQLSDFHGSSIQILLRGNIKPTDLRKITASHMNRLIRCPGIVISASRVRSRASSIKIKCSRCLDSTVVYTPGPFSGANIPTKCRGPNPAECGQSPYVIFPDECVFCDQQTLKLQECPECVPTGEMPRSLLVAAERNLVDLAPPGTRVSVIGIASLFSSIPSGGARGNKSSVRTVYLRVVGMQRDDAASNGGDSYSGTYFSPREEEAFRLLARRPDIYNVLSRSIAPSISGGYTVDIKKALSCLLFGGSQKKLPDGMRLRGDINVLLLGDPSTAKSQFLKFIHRVAPIAVYTSGKGSSAAGLTASVVRDARGEFYLEGGAMVLADGGVVCIDEFDKMRPDDRVAIHEAMEQQTISVAKAGITTVLNSRTSVLAAANPVHGRYDDMKTAGENIDLMTTILSRFDLIFLVRDIRDEDRDRAICKHVMGVHMNSKHDTSMSNSMGTSDVGGFDDMDDIGNHVGNPMMTSANDNADGDAVTENATRVATSGGELDIITMKKYIQFCRAKCSPRLSEEAEDILASSYVKIRDDVRKRTMTSSGRNDSEAAQAVIPITVRQLEALVRCSESLAKMRLSSEVHAEDVAEALRLFKVSTMAASSAGSDNNPANAGGATGLSTSREDIVRAESFLRTRLVIGTIVNKQRIIEEAAAQGYDAMNVARVIAIMVMRGEVQERNQSRLIKRIK